MKKLPILLFLLLTSATVNAQKNFTEGKIIYDITYPDMEMDPQMAAMMPTEQVVYIKGVMSRTEMSMAMGYSNSMILNGKTGEVITLTDMMGNKSAIRTTAEEVKKNEKSEKKPKVTLTGETREIAGYTCKKATVEMDGTSVEYFVTDKISASLAGMDELKDIKGFPLSYGVDQGEIKMRFTARSLNAEKVSEDKFTIPADFKLTTKEELMKQFQQGE